MKHKKSALSHSIQWPGYREHNQGTGVKFFGKGKRLFFYTASKNSSRFHQASDSVNTFSGYEVAAT